MNELALFAGAGGGILGGHLLGWRTVCAVEWEPYAAGVLCARQNDGLLPPFPIWDDVCTFDGRPWRGIVDVISGGFPCQDISVAGKGGGIEASRSGLWKEMARIVGEVLPRHVFVENSPLLVGRGAAVVIGDLAALGYDCRWACVAASDIGAPHQRDRFWLVADRHGKLWRPVENNDDQFSRDSFGECAGDSGEMENANRGRFKKQRNGIAAAPSIAESECAGSDAHEVSDPAGQRQPGSREPFKRLHPAAHGEWQADHAVAMRIDGIWPAEPDVGRVAHGVAARVDRLKAIGNGQVPRVAATAFRILS